MADPQSDVHSLPLSSSPVTEAPEEGHQLEQTKSQLQPWSNAQSLHSVCSPTPPCLCPPPSQLLSPRSQNSFPTPEFLHSASFHRASFSLHICPSKCNLIIHVSPSSQSSHIDANHSPKRCLSDLLQSPPYFCRSVPLINLPAVPFFTVL
jgi:hypothetical protein